MKKLKNILYVVVAALILTPAVASAQTSDYSPKPSWPFVYQDFKGADVYTTNGRKVFAKSNIHIGMHCLWFINNMGTKLAAKENTISKVIFRDGTKYINIDEKMCKVIREDSINGKVCCMYESEEVDKPKFDEMFRLNKQATSNMHNGFLNIVERESALNLDEEPLPMAYKYYMLYNGETFEMTNGNIQKHLADKEERKAYNVYLRTAEILFASKKSMMDIYETFFLSKLK